MIFTYANQSSRSEIERFLDVLQRSSHTSDYVQAVQSHSQGLCASKHGGIMRESNNHHRPSRAQERWCRFIGFLCRRRNHNAMGSVRGDALDFGSQVFHGLKIDILLCAYLLAQLTLLFAVVNRNDTHALDKVSREYW